MSYFQNSRGCRTRTDLTDLIVLDSVRTRIHFTVFVLVLVQISKCSETFVAKYTLKTPGSDLTRKRVPWGQTHSWVRLIWNPGKNYRNLSPKCLSDSNSGSV